MQSEMDVLLDRINKMSDMLDKSRREKEDALIELERRKEELDKERTTNKIISEEKDMNNKEFERLLEKYDRSQGDLYRIQGKLDQAQLDHDRLAMDLEKNNSLNARQKEEYNKLTNDFNGLQDMYDKTAIELAK